MALISIIPDFAPQNDDRLLAKAEALRPALRRELRRPVTALPSSPLGRGAELTLDMGEHMVGRLTLDLSFAGSHPDAPAFLRVFFAETADELTEDPRTYDGWLASGWIQEEFVHIDRLPGRLALPRRFAFRYVKLTVLDTSPKYSLMVKDAFCETETSADRERAAYPPAGDGTLDRLCEASLRTLRDCMQEVLEDGPKRDRRLWTGDLRLQALTNSVSFRRFDVIKRCLYLIAGSRFPDGRMSACLFTEPVPAADDTYLFDYALLYIAALEEYLAETGDREALEDLYGPAMEQIDYALAQLDENGVPSPAAVKDTFIDWCDELDRTGCAAAVLLYALRYALRLAERKNDGARAAFLRERRDWLRDRVRARFWNEEARCFLSNGQRAAATQVWMVLADAGTPAQAKMAMEAALVPSGPRMTTPYMHHYYVMALLHAGLRQEAEAHLRRYWGGMLEAGADTFWECWDPAEPAASPYGGLIVNSRCHAWSCTPAYILRRFLAADPADWPDV